jgi:hypothetical protein
LPVQILPYRDEHREGVRDLIVPIQREEFGIAITYDDQPDLKDIPGFYGRGNGAFWVALSPASQVVGSIALVDIGNRQTVLRKMFVHRDWRGPGKGVAAHCSARSSFTRGLRGCAASSRAPPRPFTPPIASMRRTASDSPMRQASLRASRAWPSTRASTGSR